uniref:Voltage-dependent T-type calcium channel subunit alpha n=1 Tax=Esox lucius TaxID=8010 RepID=A0A6Q2XVF4_ESOLU
AAMTTEEEGPGAEGGVAISVGTGDEMPLPHRGPSPEIEEGEEQCTLIVPYPELAPVVFFCLSQTTFPRSWCISRFSTWFERCSIMVILLNCVTLGMYQPCECKNCSTDRCQLLETFDGFIFVFFAVEMVVKMLALGIFGRRCYLGDTWNRLDFLIVMAGMLEYSMDQQDINLTAIRTVRVLRPLKAINRVPSMRILVNLLLDTLPMLGNVLLICFFVFFIFGIIGVQLWAGKLRNRCITLPHTYYMVDTEDERPFVCSLSQDGGNLKCANIPARRQGNNTCCLNKDNVTQLSGLSNGSGLCVNWNQYYTRCLTGDKNPHKDAISFDNIARAWIVIFQVITLEGWVEIMYYVMNAHCFYNFIYFILLIIIGSFFMINLCLVVVASQFSETKQREHQLMEEQRAQANSCSTLDGLTEPSASCYESVFQLVLHVLRKACRYASVAISKALFNRLLGRTKEVPGPVRRGERANMNGGGKGEGGERRGPHPQGKWGRKGGERGREGGHAPSGDPLTLPVSHNTSGCPGCVGALSGSDGAGPEGGLAVEVATHEAGGEDSQHGAGMDDGNDDAAAKDSGGCRRGCGKLWHEMRSKLCGIANSKYFNRGILIAILINSISMGIEHHNQPDELTNILEICNIVFTSMFALEMILKITAFGCLMYLKFPYNVLDGIIVIISVWEIVVQRDGGLSVLRTFRLLRVAKLIRFMPALRRQLVVLMKTVDSVATFCMLLMLFIFTFSILGMHIFGCKFTQRTETGDTVTDRKNFDSLLWAIVTVFQILTQEDWNVVLYNGMAATTPAVALYFVALMTFGNYVLFNLLVAILVEGYQAEGDANRSFSDEDSSHSNVDGSEKLDDCLKLSGKEKDWSIYLFSPRNEFRLLCQSIITHKLFDYVILVFIFLNCITVAVERPNIVQDSWERLVLSISNYAFTAIFVAEMTIKVVSQGLYLGETAYLRSSWNILDGFLVFISLIDIMVSMVAEAKILGVLRVLRLLRTLRPLRVISRFPGLRLVVETLITSLKPIGNIVLICCAFFLIFGILGVQFFKGKFYHCVGKNVKNITSKSDCIQANYQWNNQKYNFDNLGKALMSLFVVASKDGWVDIMYQGLDAVGIDKQPIINHRPSMLLYFISFLLIVSFFVLNMFVGVVVENFQKCRQNQEAEEAKRMEEKRQRRLEKKRRSKSEAQKIPYYVSYSNGRRLIHSLCTSHHLDLFITFIICVNVITMSAEHYKPPQSLVTALKYCNYFFTATFVVEALLKLIAFGFQRFFKDRWNLLDLFIVVFSVVGIVLEEMHHNNFLPINPTIIRIMRVLRIARGRHTLCPHGVGNLGLLFVLLFFIYAALGVELFGKMGKFLGISPCEGMGPHASFKHFGMALLTLFQVSTGDNWNSIMKDTLNDCPSGLSDYHCQPGFQFIYTIYFVSFVLTAQFVLMNVVVAVLMKHLDDSNKVALENAEMDAEIELELARGQLQLASCCMGRLAMGVVVAGIGPSSGGTRGNSPSFGRLRSLPYLGKTFTYTTLFSSFIYHFETLVTKNQQNIGFTACVTTAPSAASPPPAADRLHRPSHYASHLLSCLAHLVLIHNHSPQYICSLCSPGLCVLLSHHCEH